MDTRHSSPICDYAGSLPGIEYRDPDEIRAVQSRLLADHLHHAAKASPFYRSLFEDRRIDRGAIREVSDLARIPCTTKDDLTERNLLFLAVPQKDVVDVCLTSATAGAKPTSVFLSASDVARLAYNEAGAFQMAGWDANDTVLICVALDRCFMAGMAYHLGAVKLGACAVRSGAGNPAQQRQLLETTSANAIVGVPSLLLELGQYLIDNGESPRDFAIKSIVAIGEAVRDREMNLTPVAHRVEEMWGAPVYSTYASTEMETAFCECEARQGGHLRPDLLVVEILNEKGKAVPEGEAGEVVVTPLGVEAMPLVRFRTGDVSFLITEPCPCGRQTPRLGPILGRKSQMLKFKGTTLFPPQVVSAVEGIKGVIGGCVEARSAPDGTDRVALYAAVRDESVSVETIAGELRGRLRVVPEIRLIPEAELNAKLFQPGKRKRAIFHDLRRQGA